MPSTVPASGTWCVLPVAGYPWQVVEIPGEVVPVALTWLCL